MKFSIIYEAQMVDTSRENERAVFLQIDEAMYLIPRIMVQDEIEHDGQFIKIPKRPIHPKPLQDPHPPMYMAYTRENTLLGFFRRPRARLRGTDSPRHHHRACRAPANTWPEAGGSRPAIPDGRYGREELHQSSRRLSVKRGGAAQCTVGPTQDFVAAGTDQIVHFAHQQVMRAKAYALLDGAKDRCGCIINEPHPFMGRVDVLPPVALPEPFGACGGVGKGGDVAVLTAVQKSGLRGSSCHARCRNG